MHLRLQKMRAIVPPSILRKLDEQFDVSTDNIISESSSHKEPDPRKKESSQRRLFEDYENFTDGDSGQ